MNRENVVSEIKERIDVAMDNEYQKLLKFIEHHVQLKDQNINEYFNKHWRRLSQSDKDIIEYFVRNYPQAKRDKVLNKLRETFNFKGATILDKLKSEIQEFTSFESLYSGSNIQVYRIMNGSETKYLKFETIIAGGFVQRIHTRFLVKVTKNLPKNI